MNSRLRVLLMLSFSLLGLGSMAVAQDAKSPSISVNTKLSTNPSAAELKKFFDAQAAGLQNIDNSQAQQAARDALIAEISAPGNRETREYQSAYAAQVGQLVTGLNKAPMRTRLNAAIVLAKVAEKSKDLSLVNATTTVLGDKSDAVALWGAKSAAALMVPYVTTAPNPKLPMLDALAKSVKEHAKYGPLAQEALDGLTLDYRVKSPAAADVVKVVPTIQDILAFRINLYSQSLPDEPGIERAAAGFLSHSADKGQTPEMRQQTAQLLQDLLAVTVQHAARGGAGADSLIDIIKTAASSLGTLDTKTIEPVVKPYKLISRGSVFTNLESQLGAVNNALVAHPDFGNTKPYPKIAASTSPSTTTAITP